MGMTLKIDNFYNHKFLLLKNEKLEVEDIGICGNFWDKAAFIQKANDNNIFYRSNSYHDNISCMRQEIEINKKVQKIYFFGFAEWGDYCEDLIIETKTEHLLKKICFCEFHRHNSNIWNGESLMGCECCFMLDTNLNELVGFYRFLIELKSQVYIKSIILPKNPAVHIFLIVVEN